MNGKTLACIVVFGVVACTNHNKEDFFYTVGFIQSQERHEFYIDIKSFSPFPWRLQPFNYSKAEEEYSGSNISITLQNIGSDIKISQFYYHREKTKFASYEIPSNQSKLIFSGSFAEFAEFDPNEDSARMSIETTDGSNIQCKMIVQLEGKKIDEVIGIALLRTEPTL